MNPNDFFLPRVVWQEPTIWDASIYANKDTYFLSSYTSGKDR